MTPIKKYLISTYICWVKWSFLVILKWFRCSWTCSLLNYAFNCSQIVHFVNRLCCKAEKAIFQIVLFLIRLQDCKSDCHFSRFDHQQLFLPLVYKHLESSLSTFCIRGARMKVWGCPPFPPCTMYTLHFLSGRTVIALRRTLAFVPHFLRILWTTLKSGWRPEISFYSAVFQAEYTGSLFSIAHFN